MRSTPQDREPGRPSRHFERASATDLRAVVLAGEGETFCAYADIDWMRAAMQLDVEGNEQDATWPWPCSRRSTPARCR